MRIIIGRFKVGSCWLAALALISSLTVAAPPAPTDAPDKKPENADVDKPEPGRFEPFRPEAKIS
ncbi:MAG TPA: hypothetical protein VMQ54_05800, partial [Steroidobacteraceae bacterium]|nr:hypothetical protein [Steroidobacteraceae bacterium]